MFASCNERARRSDGTCARDAGATELALHNNRREKRANKRGTGRETREGEVRQRQVRFGRGEERKGKQ